MTTASQTWTQEIVELAGTRVEMVRGGAGKPLLILHDEMGHPGWLRYHEELSQTFTVYIISHPGFGKSDRLDWIASVRDMATWYMDALDDLHLDKPSLMGSSLGGWLAAEMATMSPERFSGLVLAGAAGIKPPVGEIYDMFLVVAKDYIAAGLSDPSGADEFALICPEEPSEEQLEAWEDAREMACRLSWKPYMHYPNLPHLLRRVKRLPTLILWGRDDKIVPLSAGEVYHQSIGGSQLVVLDGCGHRPEIERPDEFVRHTRRFLTGG